MSEAGNKRRHSELDDVSTKEISLDRHEREYCTCIVTNLPKSTNIKTINNFFKVCGNIKQTKFLKNIQTAKIQFTFRKEMLSALTMNFKHFNNNPQSPIITVEAYENSSLWVTNYPVDYSYIEIKTLFEEILGSDTVFEVRLPSLQFNSNKRFAYVDLLKTDLCAKAINELNGKQIGDYKLIVKMNGLPKDDINVYKKDHEAEDGKELYLTNLKKNNTDKEVFNLIKEKCGCIDVENENHFEIPIKRPDNGKIKNIGFLTFKNADCVTKILSTSKESKKFFLKINKNNKIYYQKVESKGYLERMKFKKMLKFGRKFKDYNLWLSLYPLFEDKINFLNKYQLSNYLESEIPGSKVTDFLLVTDHKGVLVKFQSEIDVSKAKLKFDNIKTLQFRNVKYSNDLIKCGSILDLANSDKAHKKPLVLDEKKEAIESVCPETDENSKSKDEVKKMTTDDFKNLFH